MNQADLGEGLDIFVGGAWQASFHEVVLSGLGVLQFDVDVLFFVGFLFFLLLNKIMKITWSSH